RVDDEPGREVDEDPRALPGGQMWVEGGHGRAALQAAEEGGHERPAIRERDGDRVARPDALRAEAARDAPGTAVQLAPGQAAAVPDQGRAIGIPARERLEPRYEVLRLSLFSARRRHPRVKSCP